MSTIHLSSGSGKTLAVGRLASHIITSLCTAAIVLSSVAYSASGGCPAPANAAFTGCYYNNLDLSGEPVLVRTDGQLQFDWGSGPPDRAVSDNFSVRWQGYFAFGAGGYTFTAVTSDGMRVSIDGNTVLDRWRDQPPYMYTFRPSIDAGTHLITVEYYERSRGGTASLNWQPLSPVSQPPVILSFTANPTSITAGQAVTLSWSVAQAYTVAIDNGVGDVSGRTSVVVFPNKTTSYRISATNSGGSASALVNLVVNTATDIRPPTAPTLVAVTPKSQSQVDLNWRATVAGEDIAGYQLTRNGVVTASLPPATTAYSDGGVVAGTGYTYSVKAFDSAGRYSQASNSLSITTPPTAALLTLTACTEITQSGTYVLGKNLNNEPGSPCINIHDTSNVELDCRQFSIVVDRQIDPGSGSAVKVTNTNGYSVHNCILKALNTTATASMATVAINNSPHGTFSSNTLSGGCVDVHKSANLEMSGNSLSATPVDIYDSDSVTLSNNDIGLPPNMTYSGNIVISRTKGSTIQNNRLEGGWDGGPNRLGADVGILLDAVSDSVVQGNTITNTWDCGIENVGLLSNVQIKDNQIRKTKYGGIGGWYGNSWRGNVVSGNTVENGDALFFIYRVWGLQAGEQSVYFKDNTFRNNTLIVQNPLAGAFRSSYIDFQNVPVAASSVIAGNNVFTGNNFNARSASPMFFPASSIVDGGGNTCGTQNQQADFPLRCGAPSSTLPVPPAAPALLSATPKGPSQIDLMWTPAQSSGIAGYQIVRNGLVVGSTTSAAFSYSDTGLVAGTSYSYAMKSYDSAGQVSGASNTIAATTFPQTSSLACPAAAANAFTACFYNNLNLTGSPAAIRTDAQISTWEWTASLPAGVAPGNFSVVWQGNFNFDGGDYTFINYTSDGMRMYVDGSLVLNQWRDQSVTGFVVRQDLAPGNHLIRVEYYNRSSTGLALVYWMKS